MKCLFDAQIAGPRSNYGLGTTAALSALNSKSELLGPGRLHSVRELLVILKWPTNATAGEVTVEGAADGTYTGTWAPLAVIPWTAGGKEDQFNYTGSQRNIRARVSAVLVVSSGSDGIEVDAQGNA